jgi:Zn-dependent protease
LPFEISLPPPMNGSLRIGSLAGIPLFIHWTFAILIGWIVWMNAASGTQGVVLAVGFVLAAFLCIILHELGHALAARRFGIQTRDITILPIGGLARLERIPEKPGQELWVALAGPAVNVVIAASLAAALTIRHAWPTELSPSGRLPDAIAANGFLFTLMNVNIFLVLFNLIPAFPMDGGRVLRALLAYRLKFATATRVAAIVGQVLAVGFAFLGIFGNPMLLFIALFVFLGAQAESQVAQVRSGLEGIPVRDAMLTHFATLNDTDTLDIASQALLAGAQQDFPVLKDGRFVGILPRADLIAAIAGRGLTARVGDAMRAECGVVHENDMLHRVFQRMRENDCPIIPVVRAGQVIGLVTLENIGELMMIRSALRQRRPPKNPGLSPKPALP